MRPGKLIIVIVFVMFCELSFSQSFIKITEGEFVNDGGWSYAMCWADFNNDGYQDLFVTNNNSSNQNNMMYFNDGAGGFTKVTAGPVVNDGGSSYGCTAADIDNDGDLDLFVSNYNENNFLYLNNGDGTFTKVTSGNIVTDGGKSVGCAFGDYDNDGFVDLYVANRDQANFLYKNNGDGTFKDVTKRAGVAGGIECSVGAVWFDYDNDGLLDLYVANYLFFDPTYKYFYAPDGFPGPMAYDVQADVLYHNKGDGEFEDVTKAMGITDIDGRGMGVGAADYDDDGFVDIYVANDHSLNYLWHNDGGKGFTDRGTMSGTAFGQSGEGTVSMSVDFADFNGDGLLDLFCSDDKYCSLYQNVGNGVFSDQSYQSGIAMPAGQYVGWSSSFIDYDNDGDVDIFKINGALKHLYGQEDQLFENIGEGKFKDVSIEKGSHFTKELVGRGASFGDYDNDGDMDAFIVNLNDRPSFLRNNKGNQNNWLTLSLVGQTSNRDGIGSRIKITSGGVVQTAQKKSTTGYLSQNDPRMHFGLGKNNVIDKLEIKWPSGQVQVLENVKANQILTVKEPK